MVWWIVSGVLLLALLVFVAVLAALAGRMRPLRRGLRRMQARADEAQKLATRAVEVQERAADLQERVEEVSAAAERLRGHAPGPPPGGFDGGDRARGSR